MKRSCLAFLTCMLLLAGCTQTQSSGMQKISADEVIRKLQVDGENSFLLVLTTTDCYSCEEYTKVVEQLEEEKQFDIYYIDVNKEDKDKLEELKITLGDVETLPMTYYFDHGDLNPDNIKWNYIELETYREWLKSIGLF